MSKLNLDPNILQIGLDSGALTMFGAVVRQFTEPGDYRGTVRRGDSIEKVFYLSVDEDSPIAAADVDLAKLAGDGRAQGDTEKDCCTQDDEVRFPVNPKGYVVFRVSGGTGGYSVNVRRADPSEKTPVFKSTTLDDGAMFSAQILRPGLYSVVNVLGKARAALTVSYPPERFSGYRPPEPLRLEVTEQGFQPEKIDVAPAQGLIFDCHAPARIVITLERPDDGPRGQT